MTIKVKKIVFIITGIVVFLCLIFLFLNSPSSEIIKPSSKFLTVDELLHSFLGNEVNANLQYLNKTLQVQGKVSAIDLLKDNQVEIALKGNQKGAILCTLKPEKLFQIIDSVKINDDMLIQGRCIGFLGDVYLKNCTVISETK